MRAKQTLASFLIGVIFVALASLFMQPLNAAQWKNTDGTIVSGVVIERIYPQTSGGLTLARIQSLASTNATSVKTTAGQLYSCHVGNSAASDAWLKLYNKASAPTVGTDAPVMTVYLPKSTQAAEVNFINLGVVFSTGIAYAITGGAADSDTTAIGANAVTGGCTYQ